MEGLPFINQEDIRNKLVEYPYVGFIVNCITENDIIEFLNFLEVEFNIHWNGKNILDIWKKYKKQTCFRIDNKELNYGNLDFYSSESYYKHLTIYQYKNNIENNVQKKSENSNIKQSKKRRIFIIEDF